MSEHQLVDGQVWFWTDRPDAEEPQPHAVRCLLRIDDDGTATLTGFGMDPITDIQTDVGPMTMTVRMSQDGTGRFVRATRDLALQCALKCRLKRLVVRVDGDLTLTLTTGAAVKPNGEPLQGRPVDAQGVLTVVAAGRFASKNNKLHDVACGLKITGRLDPPPT